MWIPDAISPRCASTIHFVITRGCVDTSDSVASLNKIFPDVLAIVVCTGFRILYTCAVIRNCQPHIPAPQGALILPDTGLTGAGELVQDAPVNLLQVWEVWLTVRNVHWDGICQGVGKHVACSRHEGVALYDRAEAHPEGLGQVHSGNVHNPVCIADVWSGLSVILLAEHRLKTEDAVFQIALQKRICCKCILKGLLYWLALNMFSRIMPSVDLRDLKKRMIRSNVLTLTHISKSF